MKKIDQLRYKFRPNEYSSYDCIDLFEKKFTSFLMYEWSKRKENGGPFNMWVSCLVIENKYIHRYDDVFLFDENETELIKKARGLLKILNHLDFPDVEVMFFVEDGDEKREEKFHLIEDLMRMKQENYLIGYDFSSIVGRN